MYPLWRELVYDPAILNRSRIFAIAANIYGFATISISHLESLRAVNQIRDIYTDSKWKEMIEYCVMPVVEQYQRYDSNSRLVFATPDPSHLHIRQLVDSLCEDRYELRFAHTEALHALISEAFPHMKSLLRPPDAVAPPWR